MYAQHVLVLRISHVLAQRACALRLEQRREPTTAHLVDGILCEQPPNNRLDVLPELFLLLAGFAFAAHTHKQRHRDAHAVYETNKAGIRVHRSADI